MTKSGNGGMVEKSMPVGRGGGESTVDLSIIYNLESGLGRP